MKKVLSIVLSLAMLFSITAGLDLSVSAETIDYWIHDSILLDDGTIEIVGYSGSETNVTIPTEVDGHTVRSIGSNTYFPGVISLTIPDCVTNISKNAFYQCLDLGNVTIYNPECSIYDSEYTILSTTVIHGYTGSTAQAYAEAYGRDFIEITDSGNTEDINEDLFNGVLHTGECKVSLTEDMTDIEYQSPYSRHYEEAYLYRPEFSMTYEYSSTVNVTGNGTDTNVQLAVGIFDSELNLLYQEEGSSGVDFKYSFEAGKTYILMNTLVISTNGIYISDLADGCITLTTSLDLNASDVEDYLNSNCENDDPYRDGWKIGNEVYGLAFIDNDGSVIDFYPDDSGLTDYNTQSINKNITSVIIPSKVDTNYSYANFYLYSIDDYAEMKVTNISIKYDMAYVNLANIFLPYSIECIDSISGIRWYSSDEIACNTGLKEISIPSSVTIIGAPAFNYCTGLTNITIPDSVESIGADAFVGCSSLIDITILNPECDLDRNTIIFPLDNPITIYGYYGSTAQLHAKEMGFTFTPLENSTLKADGLGASIRVSDAGLRFGFSYNEIQNYIGTQDVEIEEYGFIYAYSETYDLNIDSVGTNGIKQKVASNKINNGDYTTFNLVFTNIPSSAFDSVVSVRAYVKINGVYYYSDVLQRSFRTVADAVLADNEIDEQTKNAVRKILGKEV